VSDHDHGHDPGLAPEGDNTPAGLLIVLIFAVFAFMWASILLVLPVFQNEAHSLSWHLQMNGGETEADLLAAEQAVALSSYKANDDGSYAIPLAQAREAVLANPALLTGEWSVTTAAAAEPAVAVNPLVAEGKKIFQAKICMSCHSVDGTRKVGPTFKDLVGKTEKLADGSSVLADKAYIKESILDPMAKVVEGFPPAMPPVLGGMTDDEFEALFAYMNSLSATGTAVEAAPVEEAPVEEAPLEEAPADGAPVEEASTEAPATDSAFANGAPVVIRPNEGAPEGAQPTADDAPNKYAQMEAALSGGSAEPAAAEPAAAEPEASATSALELGSQLYTAKGCVACHTLDGSKGLGPSWQNAWGRSEKLTDGTTAVVDAAYIRSSILNPTAQVVEGYAPVMPPVPGGVSEAELDAFVAFIKAQ